MKSFKEKISTDKFIKFIAECYFSIPLFEEDDSNTLKYYEKPPQFITMSKHALIDGKKRNRLWWNDEDHLHDPNFTHFADECLDKLKDNKLAIKHSNFPAVEYGEVCFADKREWRGWVTSLRYSDEERSKLDSFNIVTILDKDSGTMNVEDSLFRKRGQHETPDFIVKLNNFDLQSTHKENKAKFEKSYKETISKLEELSDQYEYAVMELEDEPENVAIRKKVKQLKQQVEELTNRKANLEKSLKNIPVHESYVIENTLTKRNLLIILL